MANYYEISRTNYFLIKPEKLEQFTEFLDSLHGCTLVTDVRDGITLHGVLFDDGIPSYIYDEETEEETEVDFMDELSKFLEDGHVAICMSDGNEKMRYVSGYSEAINNKGEAAMALKVSSAGNCSGRAAITTSASPDSARGMDSAASPV